MQFNSVVETIPQALSIYINQIIYERKRKGFDVTTLSLGEAYFDIPLFNFKKLDVEKCYHYSESQGLPELRAKIASFYGKMYGAPVDYKTELLLSAGSKPLIYMAIQAVLNPGDEATIHEPAWLSYQEQLKLAGVKPKFIPYNCPPKEFSDYFNKKTRMLIINNPNNPAGSIYSRDDLLEIYRQCRSRGIYVLIDEAYSDFVIENSQFHSMAKLIPDKDGVIVVNSLSKNMGMSGLRVGYVISSPDVIQQILKLNQHLITCASTIVLHYLARYFDDIIAITLPQVKEVVKKRQRVQDLMDQLGLHYLKGGCTFYFFLDIGDFKHSSLELSLYMILKHNIAVVPGSAYGESTERFVRVSIGTESEERIHNALIVLSNILSQKTFDIEELNSMLDENHISRFQS